MKFFGPLLEFLGYAAGEIFRSRSGQELTVNLNAANGTAINIWQAKPGLADHPFEVYEPGVHHVAFRPGAERLKRQLRSDQTTTAQSHRRVLLNLRAGIQ
jgi:hypothetical protein